MRDAAVFPYGITFSGEGSLKIFPAAKVEFLNQQGEWFTLFLLIDSGAAVSVLPKADAPLFGIELKAGKPAAVAGVGADHIRGWQHMVRARLTDKAVKVPVIFLDSDQAPRILGRQDVFTRYTLIFEEKRRRSALLGASTAEAERIQVLLNEL
jgi:hypothetical protein